MNNEESKTAYPVTCQFCKGDFVVYADPDELENLEGGDWSLMRCKLCDSCYNKLFGQFLLP